MRDPRRGGGGRRRADQRGAAALELALVLPLLLLLLFGTVQYGLYFWAVQGGSDIARDAARMSAVGTPADCTAFRDVIERQVDSLTGRGDTLSVRRTYVDAPPTGINVGDVVEVEVGFRSVDLHLPFVPFVAGGAVTATVEARVESVPAPPEGCSA